ncbi:TIGR01621 family pseudouridine synthase [Thalassotalea maritima]|uniref:TIGR01621 family pseudouridine synthase n=1 Tax=Thalassotalea maritima TaxID=3242416 RepID=UPI0035273405
MTIKIVYDHADFLVINKDANVNFHDEGDVGSGVFTALKQQLNISELYPVHRLDKITSGILIFAKNIEAARLFGELFASHSIEKYYLAVSKHKPKKKQGLVQGDMAKSRRGSYKLLRSTDNPAKTRFFSYSISNGLRLFLLKPLTGRTHQIRVALNSLGSPIAGDPTYNGQDKCDRGYLHAYAIAFDYQEQRIELVCDDMPGELFDLAAPIIKAEKLDKPWQLAWPKGRNS